MVEFGRDWKRDQVNVKIDVRGKGHIKGKGREIMGVEGVGGMYV